MRFPKLKISGVGIDVGEPYYREFWDGEAVCLNGTVRTARLCSFWAVVRWLLWEKTPTDLEPHERITITPG